MRRTASALLSLSLLVALAACGDSTSDGSDGTTATTAPGGTFSKPKVDLPKQLPTDLVVTDLVTGSGYSAKTGDQVVVHYVGVLSADGTEFDNSYDRGEPFTVDLGYGKVIRGWDDGLVGVQQGTRRQLDIPSYMGYGDQGSGDIIKPGAALTFVIDVVAVLPASAAEDQPKDAVDPAENITALKVTELVKGDGPVIATGQNVAFRLEAFRADTGELLDSSWGAVPITIVFDASSGIDAGFLAAFDGMKVGGSRQAQIPFATVFSGQGSANLGLPAGIDLVVIIDVVTVY